MRRRTFIAALGGAAAWPMMARGQQQPMPVIGFLDSRSPDVITDRLRGFRQGLKESGYVEGENVAILYRWAEDQIDRLPELAGDRESRNLLLAACHHRPRRGAAKSRDEGPPPHGHPSRKDGLD